jgi:protein-tyrosine kinase
MSVIENALKKLQASRAAAAAAREGEHGAPSLPAAPLRRRTTPQTDDTMPTRSVGIDLEALRTAGLLAPPHQEREIAQQFRQIKRPLINAALGRGAARVPEGNIIVVTSAVPGEGKTFTSLNLAFSMALEEDLTVLLVDGDAVNPRLTQLFGLESEPGLLDVLADPEVSLTSALVATDVPGLAFLPAGRPTANATELLSSARMREVAAHLSTDAPRLVVFDSAPLLVTTEAQALAQLAGQILMVVKADDTQQHVVLEALEKLDEGKPVAVMLNQTTRNLHAGYHYPYGSSGRPREKSSGA